MKPEGPRQALHLLAKQFLELSCFDWLGGLPCVGDTSDRKSCGRRIHPELRIHVRTLGKGIESRLPTFFAYLRGVRNDGNRGSGRHTTVAGFESLTPWPRDWLRGHCTGYGPDASTAAKIIRFAVAGKVGQASTIRAKSGSVCESRGKLRAKLLWSVSVTCWLDLMLRCLHKGLKIPWG
jgi:hypothetical protein